MATMTVKNAAGGDETIEKPLAPGRAAAAGSRPVAIDSETKAVIDSLATKLDSVITALGTLDGRVDGLEGLITTQNGYLDGVETAIASTNTKLDALNTSTDNIEASATDVATPLPTYGPSLRSSANFNRPANTTAYDIGDLVANNTTAGSVTAMSFTLAASSGGKGMIRSVKIDKGGATGATIRAHFWTAAPTVANGDNGVFSPIKAGYLGYIDVVLLAFSDGAAGVGLGELDFDLSSGTTIYGLLEARTAYTPTSASTYTVDVTSWPEA